MTDPTPVHGSLLRRIHEVYPSLPDRERRVADIILNTPSEMPVWTATELAGWAEVSNASVSRLVQRLGYRSFEHARKDARALRETGSPLFMKETTPLEFSAGSRSDLLAVETTVIKSTLEQLSEDALRESAIALSSARRVRVLGFRNSRFLADYLAAQLSQLRPDIASLAMDGQTLGEGIAGLGVDDAVVVVGLRRRPAQFSRIVQLIANQGAKVVLISDQSLREAPAFATWTFTCSVETPQPMDSCAGALTLLRLLSSETATVLGDSGIEHLKAVEDLREDLNELEVVPWEKY